MYLKQSGRKRFLKTFFGFHASNILSEGSESFENGAKAPVDQ